LQQQSCPHAAGGFNPTAIPTAKAHSPVLTRRVKLDGDQAAEALGPAGCNYETAGRHDQRAALHQSAGQKAGSSAMMECWTVPAHPSHVIMSCAANTRTKDAFELVLLHGPMPTGGWARKGSWLGGGAGALRPAAVFWPSAGLGRCPACPPATLEGQCSTQLLAGRPGRCAECAAPACRGYSLPLPNRPGGSVEAAKVPERLLLGPLAGFCTAAPRQRCSAPSGCLLG